MTITTKISKNGNVSCKLNGERTNKSIVIEAAARAICDKNDTLVITDELGTAYTVNRNRSKFTATADNGDTLRYEIAIGSGRKITDVIAFIIADVANRHEVLAAQANTTINTTINTNSALQQLLAEGFKFTPEQISAYLKANNTVETVTADEPTHEDFPPTDDEPKAAVNAAAKFVAGKTYFRIWSEDTGRSHMKRYVIAKRTPKTVTLESGARCRIFTDDDGTEGVKVGYNRYIYATDLCTVEAETRQAKVDSQWREMEAEIDIRSRELARAEATRNAEFEAATLDTVITAEAQEVATEAEIANADNNEVTADEPTVPTFTTKTSANGSVNFYNDEGKRVKEADVIDAAIEHNRPYYSASVHGYDCDDIITADFASTLTAYKWLGRMCRKSRAYADGDIAISLNLGGLRSEIIYTGRMATAEIKDADLRAYVEAEDARTNIERHYAEMLSAAEYYKKFYALTDEQVNRVLTIVYGKPNGKKLKEIIVEIKADIADADINSTVKEENIMTDNMKLAAQIVDTYGLDKLVIERDGGGRNFVHYGTYRDARDEFNTDLRFVEVFADDDCLVLDHVNIIRGFDDGKTIDRYYFKTWSPVTPPDTDDDDESVFDPLPDVSELNDFSDELITAEFKFDDYGNEIVTVNGERLTFRNGKFYRAWSDKYRAGLSTNGGLHLSVAVGRSFEYFEIDEPEFFRIMSERGACTIDPDMPKYFIAELEVKDGLTFVKSHCAPLAELVEWILGVNRDGYVIISGSIREPDQPYGQYMLNKIDIDFANGKITIEPDDEPPTPPSHEDAHDTARRLTAELNAAYSPATLTPIAHNGARLNPAAQWRVAFDNNQNAFGFWSVAGWHEHGFNSAPEFCGWIPAADVSRFAAELKAAFNRRDTEFKFPADSDTFIFTRILRNSERIDTHCQSLGNSETFDGLYREMTFFDDDRYQGWELYRADDTLIAAGKTSAELKKVFDELNQTNDEYLFQFISVKGNTIIELESLQAAAQYVAAFRAEEIPCKLFVKRDGQMLTAYEFTNSGGELINRDVLPELGILLINEPEYPTTVQAVDEQCRQLNAVAPKGWEVIYNVEHKKFGVTFAGESVAEIDSLALATALPPEKFFDRFTPLVDEESFAADRRREIAELQAMRDELGNDAERLKTLDALIEDAKDELIFAELELPRSTPSKLK